jgi:hypothetical protein
VYARARGGGGGAGVGRKAVGNSTETGYACLVRECVLIMFRREFLVQIMCPCYTMWEFFNTTILLHNRLHL